MSGKTASRVERVIAFYGLDHLCWSEESVEEDLRDPDDFVRKLAADAARLQAVERNGWGIERDEEGVWTVLAYRRYGNPIPIASGPWLGAVIDAAMQQARERG